MNSPAKYRVIGIVGCLTALIALWQYPAPCSDEAAAPRDVNPPSLHSDRGAWDLYRQWTPAETHHFAEWINRIYLRKSKGAPEQRFAKLERILTDPDMNLLLDPEFAGEPLNPQLDHATIRAMHEVLDCGKLTVALTAYYAYSRGLPWMITHVRSGDGKDLRFASYNVPRGTTSSWDYDSAHAFFVDAVRGFCTGNYRVAPDQEGAELSDTVPAAITREFLLPGSLYYVDGHVLILGAIDEYGAPCFLDATTAASRDIYTRNGINAVTGVASDCDDMTSGRAELQLGPDFQSGRAGARPYLGCFRGFRVQRWPIVEVDENGKATGVRRRTNEEMAEFGYSTEQYDRIRELMQAGSITDGGMRLDSFHEFVRMRLRTAERICPTALLETYADQLLDGFQKREQLVQAAWAEIQTAGPVPFPEKKESPNVFTPTGRWGAWSSAALDADLRAMYFQMLELMDLAIVWYDARPGSVDLGPINPRAIWQRADFVRALQFEKDRVFSSRTLTYTNSAGAGVSLSLRDIERRLYDLSFDPNHPPELRWGRPLDASASPPEQVRLPEMPTPLPDGDRLPMLDAYRHEAYYRTLAYPETGESYLREMATEGFPVRSRFDDYFTTYTEGKTSPPLVHSE